jgi:hypothetical protein
VAAVQVEECGEAFLPLGEQFGLVDDDGGGLAVPGDQRAGHDGLPGSGRGDQYPGAVGGHGFDGFGLGGVQRAGEGDGDRLVFGQVRGDVQAAAGGVEQPHRLVGEAPGQVDPFGVGVVAADEPWGAEGGEPLVLAAVELGVVERGGVFERGE